MFTKNNRENRDVTFSTAPLVVVVDDNEAMREALESLLKSVGFRVKIFASAEGFIHSGLLCETKCLILDVRMPGMSGFELQQRLAAANQRIPIIFITAHVDEFSRARAIKLGAIAFLSKPFTGGTLLNAVRAATGSKGGGLPKAS